MNRSDQTIVLNDMANHLREILKLLEELLIWIKKTKKEGK